MSLTLVGSVALDSIETPFGKEERILGGSATHFGVAASYFNQVQLVAVIGDDFPEEHIHLLKARNIDLQGLEKASGPTFHWKGKYEWDLNNAITLETQLGVFESFDPKIPTSYLDSDFLFLANIVPEIQLKVLKSFPKRPKLVALDTMNFWIEGKLDALKQVISQIDLLIINEGEARQLTEENNLISAWKKISSWGPNFLIVKQGEYGALLFHDHHVFSAPGLPLETIKDPTGAGDSFAGGVMGYLAKRNDVNISLLKEAIIFGSTMASFNVSDFSCRGIANLNQIQINDRYKQFHDLANFNLVRI